jgi:hypothetical protein
VRVDDRYWRLPLRTCEDGIQRFDAEIDRDPAKKSSKVVLDWLKSKSQ